MEEGENNMKGQSGEPKEFFVFSKNLQKKFKLWYIRADIVISICYQKGDCAMLTAKDVAEYFLSLSEPDDEDYISNLKLQKLIYYAQGFNLAIFNLPLFDEPFEAWTHGPVVKNLYHEYKAYGAENIDRPEKIDLGKYAKQTRDLLDEVWEVYGQYSASKLRKLSHEEPPWKEAYEKCPGSEISRTTMGTFFKSQLSNE